MVRAAQSIIVAIVAAGTVRKSTQRPSNSEAAAEGATAKKAAPSADGVPSGSPHEITSCTPVLLRGFCGWFRAAQSSIVAAGSPLNPTQSPSNTKAAAKGAIVEKAATSAARVASGGSDDSASQARASAPGASAAPTGLDGDVAGRGPNDREEVCLDRDEGPDGGESSDPEVKVLHDLPVGCLSVGLCIRIFFITRIVSLSRVPDEANTLKEKRTFHAVRPFPWRGPTCADLEPAGRSCAAFHLLRDEPMAR